MPSARRKRLQQGSLFGTTRLGAVLALLTMFACSAPSRRVEIHLGDLEAGPAAALTTLGRHVVADPRALDAVAVRLCDGLSLVTIRSRSEWDALRRAVPGIAGREWQGRTVFGLCATLGTPLSGEWPVHVTGLRRHLGAGLLESRFASGTYLPDGATFAELVACDDVSTVLVVEVDGVRYYPG